MKSFAENKTVFENLCSHKVLVWFVEATVSPLTFNPAFMCHLMFQKVECGENNSSLNIRCQLYVASGRALRQIVFFELHFLTN